MVVNRAVKIAGASLVLLVLYFGLVFVSGALSARATEALKAQGNIALGNGRVEVKEMTYQRGFFQSVATGTYTVVRAIGPQPGQGPLTFKMRHVITHGPITGSGLGWARTESEIVFDPATASEMAKIFGDKKPLDIVVRHGFLGGISGRLSSPAFETEEGGSKFKFGGVQGTFAMGRNGSSLAGDFLLPKLDVVEKEGNIALKDISFKLDLHRVFEVLYEGTMAAELGEMLFQKATDEPLRIQKLGYAFDLNRKGDFIDAKVRLGSGAVEMQGFKLEKAQYDFTFKHLHGPTYASFVNDIKAKSEATSLGAPVEQAEMYPYMVSAMGEVFFKLLEKDPELVIDRIGITTDQGEFGITGSMKLVGFTPEDAEMGSLGAMSKLQANLKVFLDEPLLDIELPKFKSDPAADVDPSMADADQDPMMEEGDDESLAENESETVQLDRAKLHAQVAELEKQGLLERKGKRVESRLEFKNGQITANGKPLGGGGPM